MSTQFHAVINCQSTDLNGLPTSIEVILTRYDVNKVVDKFYCEIGGYNDSVVYSDVAKEMFQKREGVEPTTPEWAIYNLYQFLSGHGAMVGGVFRPIVYGMHSLRVLNNLIEYTNYKEHFYDTFNGVEINVMSYALLVNNFVSMGSPSGTYPYRSVNTESPSVAYYVVAGAEEVKVKNDYKAEGILEIYQKILGALIEDFSSLYNAKEVIGKCSECGANALHKNGTECFICGAKFN